MIWWGTDTGDYLLTEIPMSVRASEVSVEGSSIYFYDPKGKAAFAYMALTKEVLKEA